MTYRMLLEGTVIAVVLILIFVVFIGGLIGRNGRKGTSPASSPVKLDTEPDGDAGGRNVNLAGRAVDHFHFIEPTYPVADLPSDFTKIDAESERYLVELHKSYVVDPATGRPVRYAGY
jgi:hypothetical protein